MPHPFHPDDFPINQEVVLKPTQIFYLKGAIHFKQTARILDLTGQVQQPFANFSPAFLDEASQAAGKGAAAFEIKSCGDMMRTIKTVTDRSGSQVCDLNITFVSFGSSHVRFPPGSRHSRHEIELAPVGDGFGVEANHESFIKNSIPYFWDMRSGRVGTLYKCLNQKRVEIAKVAGHGFDKDAVLVLNGDELDHVVALATCVILLNGRDSMDH